MLYMYIVNADPNPISSLYKVNRDQLLTRRKKGTHDKAMVLFGIMYIVTLSLILVASIAVHLLLGGTLTWTEQLKSFPRHKTTMTKK